MKNTNIQTLVSLYQKLGLVVMQQKSDKSLWLLSPQPDWLFLLARVDESEEGVRVGAVTSNFLQSFVEDSVKKLMLDGHERNSSPIWIEADSSENTMPFEATALREGDSMLIIIGHVPDSYEAKQFHAQQIRENDLLKDLLEKKDAEKAQKIASRETELEQEITERRALERQLTHLAFHDALTGLPNRSLFTDRLQRAIAEAERKSESVVVMFIDLDDFKKVNDSFGHHVGDKVIQTASLRLKKCLRDIDSIARMGGDEFTILLPHAGGHQDIEIIARRLIESFDDPIVIEKTELRMAISIGISIYPNDAENEDSLLRNADTAMYFAKHTRGPSYKFYVPDMGITSSKRLALASDIELALQQKEFFLVYQPIVNIETMEVVGAEAFLRWRRSDGEIVEPDRFIPLACESDLIVKIGVWVLESSCKQLKNWRGIYNENFRMSINLSVRELESDIYKDMLKSQLKDLSLPAGSLEIEITDTMPVEDTGIMRAHVESLKSLHISTAIDRFGERKASFKSIKDLGIDTIKIDRSFSRDIAIDEDSYNIFSGLVKLGSSLSANILAEGIETQGQFDLIRESEVNEAQGYYFSEPLESHFFDQWMKKFDKQKKLQLKVVQKKESSL